MNYPDNFNSAAFEARYGQADIELSDDTLTAGAMVHLANTLGFDWCEADGWLDECLLEDEPRNADDAWQEWARDELARMFRDKPETAAKQITQHAHSYIAERKLEAAKRAVLRFVAGLGVAA